MDIINLLNDARVGKEKGYEEIYPGSLIQCASNHDSQPFKNNNNTVNF